jgi:hypothetical protein
MQKAMVIACMLLMPVGNVIAGDAPYAGLETRQIKALSPQQIDDLRAGRGMGFALAAELNDYPGPRHVLDLSGPLGLSADQHRHVSALFDEMAAQAKALGARVVKAEKRLDNLFADKRADKMVLQSHISQIARLNGELRYLHLRYHVDVRKMLSDVQISRYAELRGYGSGNSGRHVPAGNHHGQGSHK